MAFSAVTIANKFIELAKGTDPSLTNMKLQKLTYIAHGFFLALFGVPLTFNKVHAFEHGPVFPSLYKRLSQYGNAQVFEKIPSTDEPAINNVELEQFLTTIWNEYGGFDGIQLSRITHQPDTPWNQIWRNNKYGVIPDELIESHYKEILQSRSGIKANG